MRNEWIAKGILIFAAAAFLQCETPEETDLKEDLTGNSITYLLQSSSSFEVDGTVVFNERTDGTSQIEIALNNLDSRQQHPVHLHLGDISVDGAYIAALLNPVDGATGKSTTILARLADETPVKFDDLKQLDACIKIHLAAFGEGQDVVLAAGNIGSAVYKDDTSGRYKIGTCGSEYSWESAALPNGDIIF